MCEYKYGEEIDYSISLLNVTDSIKLKEFDCDNFKLNYYIHNEIIVNGQVKNEDGLIFKFVDDKKDKIIAVVSLAASAIIHTETNYMELLLSIRVTKNCIMTMSLKRLWIGRTITILVIVYWLKL